jgi:hypothetical protein
VSDVVDDPTVVAEPDLLLASRTLVRKVDLEALVQKGHDLDPFHDRLRPELDLLEPGGVRPEGHGRSGAITRSGPRHLQRCHRFTAVGELEDVVRALAVDLEHEPARKCVHNRHTDPVQPT